MSPFDGDTVPLAVIGEETEPIILDTSRRVRHAIVFVPKISYETPPRPKWADGVVPRKNPSRR